jgi:hypothetical protein
MKPGCPLGLRERQIARAAVRLSVALQKVEQDLADLQRTQGVPLPDLVVEGGEAVTDKELEDVLLAEDQPILAALEPAPPESLSAAQIAGEVLRIAGRFEGREEVILLRAAQLVGERDRLLEALRWRLAEQAEVEQARAAGKNEGGGGISCHMGPSRVKGW